MWAVIRVTGNCEGSSSYKCFNRIKDAATARRRLLVLEQPNCSRKRSASLTSHSAAISSNISSTFIFAYPDIR